MLKSFHFYPHLSINLIITLRCNCGIGFGFRLKNPPSTTSP